MIRKTVFAVFAAILAFTIQTATPAAAQACNPDLDLHLASNNFSNDSVEYHITLAEDHNCGDNIGVLIFLRYISRPSVNDAWSEPIVIDFQNILQDEMPLYALYGPYEFGNPVNIEAISEGLWTKFELEFVIYDHDTQSDTHYHLGWIDGPNNTGTLNPQLGDPLGGLTVRPDTSGGSRGTLQGSDKLSGN